MMEKAIWVIAIAEWASMTLAMLQYSKNRFNERNLATMHSNNRALANSVQEYQQLNSQYVNEIIRLKEELKKKEGEVK